MWVCARVRACVHACARACVWGGCVGVGVCGCGCVCANARRLECSNTSEGSTHSVYSWSTVLLCAETSHMPHTVISHACAVPPPPPPRPQTRMRLCPLPRHRAPSALYGHGEMRFAGDSAATDFQAWSESAAREALEYLRANGTISGNWRSKGWGKHQQEETPGAAGVAGMHRLLPCTALCT